MILRCWAAEVLPAEAGGVPGRGGVGCGVGSGAGNGVWCLRRLGGGAPVPLRLQHVCEFVAVRFLQGRHPGVRFWRSIAGCLSIAALNPLRPGHSTPCFFCSWALAQGFFIRYCVSSIAACENHFLAILAMFKARRTSDCSSCTRPLCLATVADMLNTYKKSDAASNYEMRLLPQPYTLP